MSFLFDYDLVIAFGLIGIILVLFLISRMGILPKKSLPYVAIALAGIFGFVIFRNKQKRDLQKQLDELEKQIDAQKDNAEKLKNVLGAKEEQLDKALSNHGKKEAAVKKNILLLDAKNTEEKERIENLSDEEAFSEFAQAFGK
jgi:septal ring factor EnvC (AmiA/AmiB activator)